MTKEELILDTIRSMKTKEFEYSNRFASEGAFILAEYSSTRAFILHKVEEMIKFPEDLQYIRSMYGLPKVEPDEEAKDEAD